MHHISRYDGHEEETEEHIRSRRDWHHQLALSFARELSRFDEVECGGKFGWKVFSLNLHTALCALPKQELEWGATSQSKDLWQEEAVRDVTEPLKNRVKTRPDAAYANNKYVMDAFIACVHYVVRDIGHHPTLLWISPCCLNRPSQILLLPCINCPAPRRMLETRLHVLTSPVGLQFGGQQYHTTLRVDGHAPRRPTREGSYTRRDVWTTSSDERGRCMGSYLPAEEDNPEDLHEGAVLPAPHPGRLPNKAQCKLILQRFLHDHTLDEELEQDQVWKALSQQAKNIPDEHLTWKEDGRRRGHHRARPHYGAEDEGEEELIVDLQDPDAITFDNVSFHIYAVAKLGPGTSVMVQTRLCPTQKTDNCFMRYTVYVGDEHDGSDSSLDYKEMLREDSIAMQVS